MNEALVCAVDVGTGSARAGIFDRTGRLLGRGEHHIAMHIPSPGHAEHDAADIWQAVCAAVRSALDASGAAAQAIVSIGFDATSSLVACDAEGGPVSLSTTGDSHWNTIVWLDHRAVAEADECTTSGHAVIDHAGGVMSPEMQVPKLMWIKRNLPDSWARASHFFDLADYLTYKAAGTSARSQCTLTCKWTYLAHEDESWRHDFLEAVGLGDMLERAGLPDKATGVGAYLGTLTPVAAAELGLTTACTVGAGVIDAYAGTLGALGARAADPEALERTMALIAGTSSCVMAMNRAPHTFAGGWGPYFGATLPDLWMIEGGQSATGALLDHVIRWHGAGGEPDAATHRLIGERIMELRADEGLDLAGRLHVLPDFHGNRAPLPDPSAMGVISGLDLDASFDSLCRLYWRTCVSIALGVRHILDTFEAGGFVADTLHVAGGHMRNPILMELYADATGRTIVVPSAEDAVLLGTAMVAAAAGGLYPSLSEACVGMSQPGTARLPDLASRQRFDKDYAVFLAMHEQRRHLEQLMRA